LRKEVKRRKKIIPTKKIKMKAYKRVEDLFPTFDLNDFTHELIGPQTNNILLIT
jgi:hypothetical protein